MMIMIKNKDDDEYKLKKMMGKIQNSKAKTKQKIIIIIIQIII